MRWQYHQLRRAGTLGIAVTVALVAGAGCQVAGDAADRCAPGDPDPPPTLSAEAQSIQWSTSGVPDNREAEVAMNELYRRTTPIVLDPGHGDVSSVCVPNSECERGAQAMIEACDDIESYRPPEVWVDSITEVPASEATASTGDGSSGDGIGIQPIYLVEYRGSMFGGTSGDGASFDGLLGDDELMIQRWPQDPDLPWRFVSAPVWFS